MARTQARILEPNACSVAHLGLKPEKNVLLDCVDSAILDNPDFCAVSKGLKVFWSLHPITFPALYVTIALTAVCRMLQHPLRGSKPQGMIYTPVLYR